MFQEWLFRLRYSVLPALWRKFQTNTALWPFLMTPVLTWAFFYGRAHWGIATVAQSDEVLKQLITLTGLLVTLVFAVIMPRLLADQDQRRAKLEEYRSLCAPLTAYGRWYHFLSILVGNWLERQSSNPALPLKHILRAVDLYDLDLFLSGQIDSINGRRGRRTFDLTTSIRDAYPTQPLQQALLLTAACRALAAKPITFRVGGHQYHDIYSLRLLSDYHAAVQLFAQANRQEGLLTRLHAIANAMLVKAATEAPAFYPQLRAAAAHVGLELEAATSAHRSWVSEQTLTSFIMSSAKRYDTLAEEALEFFHRVRWDFSPKKQYHLYLLACLSMVFGAVVPLGSLMFTTPATLPATKSAIVGLSAIATFSIVFSFLISAIQIFASDPIEAFD